MLCKYALPTALLILLPMVLGAQLRTTKSVASPLLIVQPLQNGGGLKVKGADGQGMHLRLTEGIIRFLMEREQGAFCVVQKDRRGNFTRLESREQITSDKPQYFLEGSLSFIKDTKHPNGYYQCLLRLRNSDKQKPLCVAWRGTAESLLLLSGNVQGYAGVHKEGLIGALGEQVLVALRSRLGEAQKPTPSTEPAPSDNLPVRVVLSEDPQHLFPKERNAP
jgi:hypothetical protein